MYMSPPGLSMISVQTTEIYHQTDKTGWKKKKNNKQTHTQRLKLIIFPNMGLGQEMIEFKLTMTIFSKDRTEQLISISALFLRFPLCH